MPEHTAGELLDTIRQESRDESEKGTAFEKLFRRLILDLPNFEVEDAWLWKKWPDRENLTKLPYDDSGIDMVARLRDGSLVAIQCKCYGEDAYVNRDEIDSFLAVSNKPFHMRWIVATCRWGRNAEEIIQSVEIPVRRIDFHDYDDIQITADGRPELEKRDLYPLQAAAIKSVVSRLTNGEDRGQLIMACGTGKTFTSLRIAERMGGRVLFLAPSITLVSQARREWLTHATNPLRALVVCSDRTSGGRGESDDIRVSELECGVTTDPKEIADALSGGVNVVFCTYQSLKKVSEAQLRHGAPKFDLMVADEAHRTTGVDDTKSDDTGFHILHDSDRVRSKKRLYMTATPRVYEAKSRRMMESRGYTIYDMEDYGKFGEVLYRLTFKKAVDEEMLSDYRVVVMIMRDNKMIHDLYDRYLLLDTKDDRARIMKYEDVERLVGTALAINGITGERQTGEKMPRVLGFANSRKRSKAFKDLLNMDDMHEMLRARLGGSDKLHAVSHVDGNSTVSERDKALRQLDNANENNPHMIMNVKLFTEGVDVPSLSAAAFLDPRDSMVDIVQAVGRVMRRAEGKEYGRIIIPVPVKDTDDVGGELESKDGWQATGRVLRALQAHDGRLVESPLRFMDVHDPLGPGDGEHGPIEGFQDKLQFEEISEQFYSKVVAQSGLARPGQMVTDEITWAVESTGKVFAKSGDLDMNLAGVLGLKIDAGEFKSMDVCKIAALLVINACLLHRRLQDKMDGLPGLGDINGSTNPRELLMESWGIILEKDYAPVFEPALKVVGALPDADRSVRNALYRLVDRADAMADSLNELGYDHAGPLYHRILGTAESDSANYTDNVSAIMLARLAFSEGFTDWDDVREVTKLRVMDPACGTGTLLMAALKTIKDRTGYDSVDEYSRVKIHTQLVEDVLCGLDINRHAVQLAACNLTLGAPTIDYKNMNLYTMKHGPQPGEDVMKAGSVEILRAASGRDIWKAFVQPLRDLSDMQARQVDDAGIQYPIRDLDAIIMNPPFGSNKRRNRKFPPDVVKQMQKNELAIRTELRRMDNKAGDVIDTNSISTFFTPLADRLLDPKHGTLARVLAVTECTSVSALDVRKFLADRFWVERIITTHDPKRLNFSYKTSIHECLMVCRRHNGDTKPPTEFVSLYMMPKNAKEATEAADAISSGDPGEWGSIVSWPSERVGAGDWSPVQWLDAGLAREIMRLESSSLLEPVGRRYEIGPAGRRIYDAYEECSQDDVGAVMIFDSVSATLRRTIHATPESCHKPKQSKKGRRLAERYWGQRSVLLVAQRFDTISGRLTALHSDEATVGKGWVPVSVKDERTAKALAVWLNSTPTRMMLLNRRGKKLTYPAWSLKHLEEIYIPKPDNPGWGALRRAYDRVCDVELRPLKHAVEDPVRAIIDESAAKVLEMDHDILAGWRERLAREPTINNNQQLGI